MTVCVFAKMRGSENRPKFLIFAKHLKKSPDFPENNSTFFKSPRVLAPFAKIFRKTNFLGQFSQKQLVLRKYT
jgi:hypothetical protein